MYFDSACGRRALKVNTEKNKVRVELFMML